MTALVAPVALTHYNCGGRTQVIAYVPGIHDWGKHKVFVQKHWYDVAWKIPPPAVNPIGTDHRLVTTVTRHSDGAPLAGYEVTYTILDGPAAVLVPGNKTTAAGDVRFRVSLNSDQMTSPAAETESTHICSD